MVLPDYDTAPEVRYPVAEEEAADITRWTARSGAAQGWDGDRLALSGVSAGAKLAITACQQLHAAGEPQPRALALVVPVTDAVRTDRTSAIKKPAISPLVQRFVAWAYYPDVARRQEALASPRLDPSLSRALPPTLVLTGEHDILAPEGAEPAQVLRTGGVEVEHHQYPGADHDFVAARPVETIRDALLRLDGFLRPRLSAAR